MGGPPRIHKLKTAAHRRKLAKRQGNTIELLSEMAKQMLSTYFSVPFSTLRRHFQNDAVPSLLITSKFSERSIYTTTTTHSNKQNKKRSKKGKEAVIARSEKEKKRTRSAKEFDVIDFYNNQNDNHVPVMLGEVLDVFSSFTLRSLVDCTLGAAGHSTAIIKSHPELERYIGMDVDPVAHDKAQDRIEEVLRWRSGLRGKTIVRNFRGVKSAIGEVDESLLQSGVDGILMDLGMSSMQVNDPERGFSVLADGPLDMRMDPQATLKAEDILNTWPVTEVGRILRDYGEESNWRFLQKKIVQARVDGGLFSTGELRNIIQNVTGARGGRQGWIKTATRVFQALRIAVNDELGTLEKSIHDCFECLAPGGRLAVISFHSLEDRVVKQTFLNIIGLDKGDSDGDEEERVREYLNKGTNDTDSKELWIKKIVRGRNGTILTKRPITPSEEEETLNRRCRSAKLRVIEKHK